MAIDAATYDATTAQRPASARPASAPVTAMVSRDSPDCGEVGGTSDMSFWDFIDIINPLQHIPVVNTIYRQVTGDTIQPSSRVIGGILFGGPLGGMASIANAVIEQAEGQDIGDQVASALGFDNGGQPTAPGSGPAAVAVAERPADTMVAGNAAAGTTVTEPKPAEKGGAQPIRLAERAMANEAAAKAGNPQAAAQRAAQQTQGGALRDAFNATSDRATSDRATGDRPHPTRMPARDTLLANSLQAKHMAPQFAAPMPGSTPAQASAARTAAPAGAAAAGASAGMAAPNAAVPNVPFQNGHVPVSPEMLSETMMRNLAKYEQSRKAAQQQAAPGLRMSS